MPKDIFIEYSAEYKLNVNEILFGKDIQSLFIEIFNLSFNKYIFLLYKPKRKISSVFFNIIGRIAKREDYKRLKKIVFSIIGGNLYNDFSKRLELKSHFNDIQSVNKLFLKEDMTLDLNSLKKSVQSQFNIIDQYLEILISNVNLQKQFQEYQVNSIQLLSLMNKERYQSISSEVMNLLTRKYLLKEAKQISKLLNKLELKFLLSEAKKIWLVANTGIDMGKKPSHEDISHIIHQYFEIRIPPSTLRDLCKSRGIDLNQMLLDLTNINEMSTEFD